MHIDHKIFLIIIVINVCVGNTENQFNLAAIKFSILKVIIILDTNNVSVLKPMSIYNYTHRKKLANIFTNFYKLENHEK